MSPDTAGVQFDKLFASIDAMDTESVRGGSADFFSFRFGSSPVVTGRDGIRASVNDFFSMFAGLKHDLHRVVADENGIVCEGEVAYTRHDGSKITLPFCNVFEADSGLISLYRIYIDIGPLYSE